MALRLFLRVLPDNSEAPFMARDWSGHWSSACVGSIDADLWIALGNSFPNRCLLAFTPAATPTSDRHQKHSYRHSIGKYIQPTYRMSI